MRKLSRKDPSKMKKKARFKVGQVVVYKHGNWQRPEFLLINSIRWHIDDWCYTGHREIDERNLRPLTARERGKKER